MKRIARSRAAALTLFLTACYPRGAMGAYEDVGVGARVSGLGQAYTAVADDVYAVYYNPAGLSTLQRPELSTTYSRLLTGLSDGSNLSNSFVGYAHPLDGGRRGTLGVGWNYLTLGRLYRESQLLASYARALGSSSAPGRFHVGATVKYLSRSLGGTPEAARGVTNTGVVTNSADPALQRASKSNLDADLGLLWRVRPRWTVGFAAQHLLEPNVGFSETDKLKRNLKLGGSYRTPFSTLAADARLQAAPDGSTDKIFALAAEKWLPTLLHGSFGARGALSMGSRDHRQLSLGLSYKISRMQFDYGFALPVGGLSATSGSHRLGLTVRFGRARLDEGALNEAIFENLRDLAEVGTPAFQYQAESLARYKWSAIKALLDRAQLDASAGRYAAAAEGLAKALSLNPMDEKLRGTHERVSAVAEVFPALKGHESEPSLSAVYEAAYDYIAGDAKTALEKLGYAAGLSPSDERIERLAKAIEAKSGLSRAPAPLPEPTAEQRSLGAALARMEAALAERDFRQVIALAERVLQLDPSNVVAYKRLGAANYALERDAEALKALLEAYRLETDAQARRQIKVYIDALQARVGGARREAPASKRAEPKAAALTPLELERLYESGVELYAQGKLREAAALFRRILESEPGNGSARRALERVQSELIQGGEAR